MTSAPTILDALLDSIHLQLQNLRCLDLTRDARSLPWMRRRGISCRRDADPSDRFDLLICEARQLDDAVVHGEPDGLVLVRTEGDDDPLSLVETRASRRIAQVRANAEHWHLLTRNMAQSSKAYDMSVVVTCQDQALAVAGLLTILAVDESELDWELVIVDRGSFDETAALLRALRGDLQILRRPRSTCLARAIDAGLRRCKSDIAVVIEPGLVPALDWMRDLVRVARSDNSSRFFSGEILDADDVSGAYALLDAANGPPADASLPHLDSRTPRPDSRPRHPPQAPLSSPCPSLFGLRVQAYLDHGSFPAALPINSAVRDLATSLGGARFVPGLHARRTGDLRRLWTHGA